MMGCVDKAKCWRRLRHRVVQFNDTQQPQLQQDQQLHGLDGDTASGRNNGLDKCTVAEPVCKLQQLSASQQPQQCSAAQDQQHLSSNVNPMAELAC
eukprot:13366-Heterococcus_DN1.PRE.3